MVLNKYSYLIIIIIIIIYMHTVIYFKNNLQVIKWFHLFLFLYKIGIIETI